VLAVNRVTSYFDASGGQEHEFIIVAGYLSTVGKWNKFDTEWRRVLARAEFNVPYFHMWEFAHSERVFKGWKGEENRRRRFINCLVGLIGEYALAGFACGIEKSVWDDLDRKYTLSDSFGCPFALAGRDCVNKAHYWGEAMHHYGRNEIRAVFEDGDDGKGDLMRVIKEAQKPNPAFEPGRPKPKLNHPGTTPLQAADFAAWELLKATKVGDLPLQELRVSLQKLSKAVPVSWTQYKESDFMALCSLGGLARRKL